MEMNMLNAFKVLKAIMAWPGRYEDEGGNRFEGMPVSQVPSQLIREGWRNVSHLAESDFEDMGLEIVTARYVGGVRPKKFCQVVVAKRLSKGDLLTEEVLQGIKCRLDDLDYFRENPEE
jgi:hypothetical protein